MGYQRSIELPWGPETMTEPSQPPYPHLLAPLQIGRHTPRNRVIMGSMHTRLEEAPRALERRVAFYAERAGGRPPQRRQEVLCFPRAIICDQSATRCHRRARVPAKLCICAIFGTMKTEMSLLRMKAAGS